MNPNLSVRSRTLFPVRRRSQRRGMAVLLVMVILSVTLATAYAVIYSESQSLQIQQNSSSRAQARQAALTGLSVALRKMHQSSWSGVGTDLEASLSSTDRYEVAYTHGDASLTEDHPDYDRYPLRVTIRSTGYSTSGANEAEHVAQAVVELVPRNLASEPSCWSELVPQLNLSTGIIDVSITPPTLDQYASGSCFLNPPIRIEGPVRLRAELQIGTHYAWSNSTRLKYFDDLRKMRLAGLGDLRPFTGPVRLPYSSQSDAVWLLQSQIGVTTADVSASSLSGFSAPDQIRTYRLFPGGPQYSVPRCGTTVADTTLEADPQTNPLGVFYCSEDVSIENNVTLRGTLVVAGDMELDGRNVQMQAASLPALYQSGTAAPIELPVLVVQDDLRAEDDCRTWIRGMATVFDDFQLERSSSNLVFDLTGQLTARDLEIHRRSDWDYGSSSWSVLHSNFLSLLQWLLFLDPSSTLKYFPSYLDAQYGLDPDPRIELRPRTDLVRYHWLGNDQSFYIAHPDDPGLRWDIISWQDGL